MKTLAEAVLNLAAFLELSGDDVVDPDSAVAAMEDMAATLQRCTPEELNALRTVAKDLTEQDRPAHGRKEARQFYLGFMEDAGLAEPRRDRNRSTPTRRSKTAKSTKTATVKKPAKPDITKRFWKAVECYDIPTMTEILEQQPAFAKAAGNLGITALQWAAQDGRTDLVQFLLERGAEINAADKDGDTALHWSALDNSKEHQATAKLLIARGADVAAKNNEGQTPRQKARSFGKNRVLLGLK
jgi:hypothetical protein